MPSQNPTLDHKENLIQQDPNLNGEIEKNFRRIMSQQESQRNLLRKLNLNFTFATTGTLLMAFKSLISFFINDDVLKEDSKTNVLKRLGDFCHRLRDVCQYSIYAQPGENISKPDDVVMDYVDDIDTTILGRKVYNLNAFVSPWVGVFKAFFPYAGGVLGLPSRLAQAFDDFTSLVNYTFWDFRKIVWSLVPYDGLVSSKNLYEKQNQVKDISNFILNRMNFALKSLVAVFIKPNSNHGYNDILYEQEKNRIKKLVTDLIRGYIQKAKTFISSEYSVKTNDGNLIVKKVGEEEPENHWLFVRAKIFSQILSLPVGIVSASLNYIAMAGTLFGNVFDSPGYRAASRKIADYSHGLLSLCYLTGEVPANINEFFKKKNIKKYLDFRNLTCAGIGLIGMLNKVKILPVIRPILTAFKIKPLLDLFDREFDNFSYLFFSFNRYIVHETQRQEMRDIASYKEVETVNKFNNWWKFANLPFRVIMQDEEVSYSSKTSETTKRSDIY